MTTSSNPAYDDLYVAVHRWNKATHSADHEEYQAADLALQAAMEAVAPGEDHIILLWPTNEEKWSIRLHRLRTGVVCASASALDARVIITPPQIAFSTAIRADEDMTDENKARWLTEIAAERVAREEAAS